MKIGACGNRCDTCNIYIATENNDTKLLKSLAKQYTSKSLKLKAKHMACKGCHNDEGVHYKFCQECKIKQCVIDQNLTTCGECISYPCKMIEQFNANKIENQTLLAHIRSL